MTLLDSYSKDFESMLVLMDLKLGDAPNYKVEEETVPPSRSVLMFSDDLPSIEQAPDKLKWVIKQTRRQDIPQEQLGLLDILGLYKSDSKGVILYSLLIELVALKRGWPVEVLQRIVHWHELAHAANHLGLDSEQHIWEGFAFESADVLEYFAQIYTYKMLDKVGDKKALEIMEDFTPRQPTCYQTYLPDKKKALKTINLALLEARRRAPAKFPHFEEAFSSSWGISYEGFWEEENLEDANKLIFLTTDYKFPKPKKRGSSVRISGLEIRIRSYDYTPRTRTLEPEVAYRLFEITSDYIAGKFPVGTLDERVVTVWKDGEQQEFSVNNVSTKDFWNELCDAISLQLPTFARVLRNYY